MNALRNALRAAPSSGTPRAAVGAVASQVSDVIGLEAEKWVAAEIEDTGVPVFSEPLTIDELQNARRDFESAFDGSQQAPACPVDDASTESSEGSIMSLDADQQMERIGAGNIIHRQSCSDFLDAAVLAARSASVQQAVIQSLLQSPEALAALERGLARSGISFNLLRLHELQVVPSLLPNSAAPLEGSPSPRVVVEEVHEGRSPFERALREFLSHLASFGGRVTSALRCVGGRWKLRIDALLNPGKNKKDSSRYENGYCQLNEEDRFTNVVDGIVTVAMFFIVIALFKRVPLRG